MTNHVDHAHDSPDARLLSQCRLLGGWWPGELSALVKRKPAGPNDPAEGRTTLLLAQESARALLEVRRRSPIIGARANGAVDVARRLLYGTTGLESCGQV